MKNKIYYKILDNSGLAFNNLTGIKVGTILEYIGRHHITNQLILKQIGPGFVMMDDKSVELVKKIIDLG